MPVALFAAYQLFEGQQQPQPAVAFARPTPTDKHTGMWQSAAHEPHWGWQHGPAQTHQPTAQLAQQHRDRTGVQEWMQKVPAHPEAESTAQHIQRSGSTPAAQYRGMTALSPSAAPWQPSAPQGQPTVSGAAAVHCETAGQHVAATVISGPPAPMPLGLSSSSGSSAATPTTTGTTRHSVPAARPSASAVHSTADRAALLAATRNQRAVPGPRPPPGDPPPPRPPPGAPPPPHIPKSSSAGSSSAGARNNSMGPSAKAEALLLAGHSAAAVRNQQRPSAAESAAAAQFEAQAAVAGLHQQRPSATACAVRFAARAAAATSSTRPPVVHLQISPTPAGPAPPALPLPPPPPPAPSSGAEWVAQYSPGVAPLWQQQMPQLAVPAPVGQHILYPLMTGQQQQQQQQWQDEEAILAQAAAWAASQQLVLQQQLQQLEQMQATMLQQQQQLQHAREHSPFWQAHSICASADMYMLAAAGASTMASCLPQSPTPAIIPASASYPAGALQQVWAGNLAGLGSSGSGTGGTSGNTPQEVDEAAADWPIGPVSPLLAGKLAGLSVSGVNTSVDTSSSTPQQFDEAAAAAVDWPKPVNPLRTVLAGKLATLHSRSSSITSLDADEASAAVPRPVSPLRKVLQEKMALFHSTSSGIQSQEVSDAATTAEGRGRKGTGNPGVLQLSRLPAAGGQQVVASGRPAAALEMRPLTASFVGTEHSGPVLAEGADNSSGNISSWGGGAGAQSMRASGRHSTAPAADGPGLTSIHSRDDVQAAMFATGSDLDPSSGEGLLRSIQLLSAPADAYSAHKMQAEFQFALFAHHSKYVVSLLQPADAAKLAYLMRISPADLELVLEQPQPEQLLDALWEQHAGAQP